MPRPPAGSPARPRSDRWWCRCFAELVLVDELARAYLHSGLCRGTPKSGEELMIVSTWQFFQKRFCPCEPRLRCKGVKLAAALKSLASQSPLNSQSSPPNSVQIQRVSRRSNQSYQQNTTL